MKQKPICVNCENECPKHGMKTCSRKCADEYKSKQNSWTRNCVECQTEFKTRNSNKKLLCSEACRKVWSSRPENVEFRIKTAKAAIKEKFGVDNVFQLEDIKTKSKATKKKLYGDENYNNSTVQIKTTQERHGENYFKDLHLLSKAAMQKEYGVDHPLKIQKFIDKQKKTNLEKYGVENVSQNEEVQQKRVDTMMDLYGVENMSQIPESKIKCKETSLKNFGVTHHLKDYNRLQKHLKISYKVKEYKDTKLNYQGSYELYFLELMEAGGKLKEVNDGHSFKYEFIGQKHTYHTDYFVRGENIEIKSGWTYNNNGANEILEAINYAKWHSVSDAGAILRVLKSKTEILEYVVGLK